jgi:hypothetical protein
MSNIIPAPQSELEIAKQAPVPVVDIGLDREGVIKAAAELGMVVSPDRLMASHTLGRALKQVGVLKIGRTMLMKAADGASTGLDQCEEVMEALEDPEAKASILSTKFGFVRELRENAVAFIRSAELDGNDDSDKKHGVRPFAAGAQAGPVVYAEKAVVNTQVNQTK